MRKLLLLAAIAMAVVSCQRDEMEMTSQDFEVYSDDWNSHQTYNEKYYYFTFNYNRLTRGIYERGQVTATRYVDGVQAPLGETRHFNDGVEWTETVRMDYEPGKITFIVSYSDYDFIDDRPKDMRFRVVLTSK